GLGRHQRESRAGRGPRARRGGRARGPRRPVGRSVRAPAGCRPQPAHRGVGRVPLRRDRRRAPRARARGGRDRVAGRGRRGAGELAPPPRNARTRRAGSALASCDRRLTVAAPRNRTELSLAEAVCLTLVAREPTHGWAIVKTLAPEGDIGRIWSLSRPL